MYSMSHIEKHIFINIIELEQYFFMYIYTFTYWPVADICNIDKTVLKTK